MNIIIDLLDKDIDQIPKNLEGCQVIRSYGVPIDETQAEKHVQWILDGIRENPSHLTIFAPLSPLAFKMVLELDHKLSVPLRPIWEKGGELVDLGEING
jgi:hypothetical protein